MVQLWEENGKSEVTVEQHWGHGLWDREKGSSEKLLMQLWPETKRKIQVMQPSKQRQFMQFI